MAKVMKCDTSLDDAYAQYDFGVAQSDVYLTLEAIFDPAALAAFQSAGFSGDFGRIRGAGGIRDALGFQSPPDEWIDGKTGQTNTSPAPAADTSFTIELHYHDTVVIESWVDGTAVGNSGSASFGTATNIRAGAISAPNDPDAIIYIDNVKAGTTRGGDDLFSDDFEDGTLDAWSSTFGDVSVVDDPYDLGPVELPVTEIVRDGVEPPTATDSASDGMFVADNDGRILVEIVSEDAGAQTVGFAITETIDGQPARDKTVTVPAGDRRVAGPFPEYLYNQTDGSLVIHPSVDGTLKLRAYACKRDVIILDG